MPGYKKRHAFLYLNRIALENKVHPYDVDPFKVIKTFFEYDTLAGTIELFRLACNAALTEKYSWKQGSAGNLVNFYEQLEMLIEACWIIAINKKKLVKQLTKTRKTGDKKLVLPCPLTRDELQTPLFVIEQFFALHSLGKWKQLTHCWMEAGISNYSVVENINYQGLLLYCQSIEKLIYAAYWLSELK
jgi:hypothetical protein